MTRIELVASLEGHTGPAWDVAWNPTRSILATCSSDKSVRLYSYRFPQSASSSSVRVDFSPPKFQLLTEIPSAHKRTVRSVAWSPTGKTLATGSFDSTVGIWEEVDEVEGIDGADPERATHTEEPKEWECITTLEGHESECKSVRWSSDGNLLASCSRDKSVWIWERMCAMILTRNLWELRSIMWYQMPVQQDGDFECISVLMEHAQDVKALAWHPAEEVRRLPLHICRTQSLTPFPNQILASASYDASVLLFADDPDSDWCPFQKLETRTQPHMPPSSIVGMADDDDGEIIIPPLKEPDTVWSAAFSPDGRYLATGGDSGGIVFWWRT